MCKIFEMDLRSLALFRIGIALLILFDIGFRLFDLTAHYGEEGVLPLQAATHFFHYSAWTSFHYWSGSPLYQALLFGLNGCAALALLVGYRTRLMTLFCWIFMLSLHDRNPLILNGGDILFKMMLFWSLFLPLGGRFSLDSRHVESLSNRVLSWGTAAYLLQIAIVYWGGGFYKWFGGGWQEGTAIHYALFIDQYVTPIGAWMREWSAFFPFLTYFTYYFEVLGPVVALSPWQNGPLRTLVTIAFILMHTCFGLCLAIGIFPTICVVAWIPFFPTWFWDRLTKQQTPENLLSSPKELFNPFPLQLHRVEASFVALCLVYTAYLNVQNVFPSAGNLPLIGQQWKHLGKALHINQHWPMFSVPLYDDGWYVMAGTLVNGRVVDLFRPTQPFSWEEPPLGSAHYPNARWRKYIMNLWSKAYIPQRPLFAQYLAREWDKTHLETEQVASVDVYYILRSTPPPNGPPKDHPIPVHIWHQSRL